MGASTLPIAPPPQPAVVSNGNLWQNSSPSSAQNIQTRDSSMQFVQQIPPPPPPAIPTIPAAVTDNSNSLQNYTQSSSQNTQQVISSVLPQAQTGPALPAVNPNQIPATPSPDYTVNLIAGQSIPSFTQGASPITPLTYSNAVAPLPTTSAIPTPINTAPSIANVIPVPAASNSPPAVYPVVTQTPVVTQPTSATSYVNSQPLNQLSVVPTLQALPPVPVSPTTIQTVPPVTATSDAVANTSSIVAASQNINNPGTNIPSSAQSLPVGNVSPQTDSITSSAITVQSVSAQIVPQTLPVSQVLNGSSQSSPARSSSINSASAIPALDPQTITQFFQPIVPPISSQGLST